MTKHTQGPWYLSSGPDALVYGADNTVILPHSAEGFTTDTQWANARLIALAPVLLALLERYDELSRANDDWIDGSDEEPWSFVTYTRNLIAKLKGEN